MPAFRVQTGKRTSQLIKSVMWETLFHLSSYCLGYLYLLLLFLTLSIRSLRRRVFNNAQSIARQIAVLTFTVITLAIFFKYFNGPRTAIFGQIAAALGIIGLTRHWIKKERSACGKAAVICVALLAAVSLGAAIKVQIKLTHEITEVRRMAEEEEARSGVSAVFYDPTPISLGIDLMKPTYMVLNTDYGARGIRIFPSDLKDFSVNSPEVTWSSDSSLMIYRNRLLKLGAEPEERVEVILIYEDGGEQHSRTRVRDFVTSEGDTVTYVFPHTQALGSERKIKDARIVNL